MRMGAMGCISRGNRPCLVLVSSECCVETVPGLVVWGCSTDGCSPASYVAFRLLGVDADDQMAMDARAWVCYLNCCLQRSLCKK